MEELLSILEEIQPDIDYMNCDSLIDDSMLDSFSMLSLVSEIEDVFEVELSPEDLVPDNFNSIHKIWDMICRLK